MKRKLIIILTSATAIIGIYVVVDKIGMMKNGDGNIMDVGKEGREQDVAKNKEKGKEKIVQPERVEKEIRFLTEDELNKLREARDPFETAPEVEEENERRKFEYDETMKKIQNRIDSLQQEEERKQKLDKNYETNEVEFDNKVNQEIENVLNNLQTNINSTIDVENQTNDNEIKDLVKKYADIYGVDENLMLAIIGDKTMKDKNQKIKNQDGTYTKGLMQISEKTAKWIAKKTGDSYIKDMEYDPETNIKYGAYYLKYLKGIENNEDYVITAYYIGPGGAERYYKANKTYVSTYSNIIKKRK